MRAPSTLRAWRLVDASAQDVTGADAVDAALSREQATLWYGSRCFEFTSVVDDGGDCLLRLDEVGRRAETSSGSTVLLLVENGHHEEQRVAPRQGSIDEEAPRGVDGRVVRAIGESLFSEVARVMGIEEPAP